LGPVPAERDLWVRSQIERSGKQIELASAEMQTLGARESWITQRLISSKRDHDAVAATLRGGRGRQQDRFQTRHHQVDVPQYRPGRACAPDSGWQWIGIRAETNYGPDGIGTTMGTLFDERGAIGSIQQAVLVRRR
jgi:hypothetical protein